MVIGFHRLIFSDIGPKKHSVQAAKGKTNRYPSAAGLVCRPVNKGQSTAAVKKTAFLAHVKPSHQKKLKKLLQPNTDLICSSLLVTRKADETAC